ncbi:9609_t:CDS:1, partial [Racocetra persica]
MSLQHYLIYKYSNPLASYSSSENLNEDVVSVFRLYIYHNEINQNERFVLAQSLQYDQS